MGRYEWTEEPCDCGGTSTTWWSRLQTGDVDVRAEVGGPAEGDSRWDMSVYVRIGDKSFSDSFRENDYDDIHDDLIVRTERVVDKILTEALVGYGFEVKPGRDGGVAFKIRGYEIAWTSQRPNGSWCLVGLSSEDPFANPTIIATDLSDSRIEAMTHALGNIDHLKKAARVAVRWSA